MASRPRSANPPVEIRPSVTPTVTVIETPTAPPVEGPVLSARTLAELALGRSYHQRDTEETDSREDGKE